MAASHWAAAKDATHRCHEAHRPSHWTPNAGRRPSASISFLTTWCTSGTAISQTVHLLQSGRTPASQGGTARQSRQSSRVCSGFPPQASKASSTSCVGSSWPATVDQRIFATGTCWRFQPNRSRPGKKGRQACRVLLAWRRGRRSPQQWPAPCLGCGLPTVPAVRREGAPGHLAIH